MRNLRDFIAAMDDARARPVSTHRAEEYAPPDAPDEVVTLEILGLDFRAVLLPSELLTEDRVLRMNRFWNLLGEQEALVVAVCAARERHAVA